LGRDGLDLQVPWAILDGGADQVLYATVSVGPLDQLVYDLVEGTFANYRLEQLIQVVRHKLPELLEAECGHESLVE
jgi:hypothetical protein